MAGKREIRHLGAGEGRLVPWKNGRGVTRELACWPESAAPGDFAWRLSVAAVDEPGPFSAFPGVERILTVIRGPGLVLSHGEEAPRARLRRLEPYRFSGDWPTVSELPGGPITDFNVMTRAGRVRAEVEALRLGRRTLRERLGSGQAFLHVVAGALQVRVTGEEQAFALQAEESLWMTGLAGGEECEVHGSQAGTELLLVLLHA